MGKTARSMSVNNSAVSIPSTQVIWMCHEGTGTDLNANTDYSAAQTPVDLSAGTNTNIWDEQGNFKAAGDHAINFLTGFFESLPGSLSSDAFGAAQFLFFVDFVAPNNPSAVETFLMYGNQAGANYHGYTIQTDGSLQAESRDALGVSVTTGSAMGDVCDGNRHSFLAFVDFVNGNLEVYLDGASADSATIDSDNASGGSSRDFGIFANITNEAGTTFDKHLGAGGSGVYLNRMGFIRPVFDLAPARVGDIARALFELPHELPIELNGV